ncbi:MAG: ferredoxin, partial [Myxococcales bacterium]|nr:ferredoxin [Myxococcales bacterium]
LNRASEIGSATTSSVAPTALPARREGAAPAAAAPVSEAPAAAAAPPEEEDDIAPLSDPYIDTPLCTTCNECTNLNGKLFAYNTNKQAVIADPAAGTYRELVIAAEKCPVRIIHPGQPKNPDEPELEALIARAKAFN